MDKFQMFVNMDANIRQHIEEFAAAFVKRTGLDPSEIEMVVRYKTDLDGLGYDIWFQPRGESWTKKMLGKLVK